MNNRPLSLPARMTGWIASPRLGVICLALLMMLTFWGTVYQVYNGLYAAQQRFFNSWVVMIWGAIPFPGAQLVLAVMLVNLTGSMIRMLFKPRLPVGLLVIHAGLVTLLLGGAISRMLGQESHLSLMEGQSSNVSASSDQWELCLIRHDGERLEVAAIDVTGVKAGEKLTFAPPGIEVEVEEYHVNARPRRASSEGETTVHGRDGLAAFDPLPPDPDPERNLPGGIFRVGAGSGDPIRVAIQGEDAAPDPIRAGDADYELALRHKRYPLPFLVKLVDFRRDLHPGTSMAKAFSSKVAVSTAAGERELTISMNKPFRDRGFTLFQSSYFGGPNGREGSVFAVAQNAGRLIPYYSTGLVTLGMTAHFLIRMFQRARRASAPKLEEARS